MASRLWVPVVSGLLARYAAGYGLWLRPGVIRVGRPAAGCGSWIC